MNFEALFLFLILVLGLVLCSFLGGNCNKEGFSAGDVITTQLVNGAVFSGSNGGTIKVNISSNGTKTLDVTTSGNQTPVSFTTDNKTIVSPDGFMIMSFVSPDKKSSVLFSVEPKNKNVSALLQPPNLSTPDSTGNLLAPKIIYTLTSSPTTSSPTTSSSNYFDNFNHFSESNSNTKYFGSTGLNIPPSEINSYTGKDSDNKYSDINFVYDYSSSLPTGIPKSQIVSGQEDLYILKTQVVPPVCPACPMCPASSHSSNKYEITNKYETTNNNDNDINNDKYETTNSNDNSSNSSNSRYPSNSYNQSNSRYPSDPVGYFDSKKLPNYNSINNSYLPVPVLADFSTFGM